MSDATSKQPKKARLPRTESPAAAQAFLDYVEMGPGRSLEALRDMYLGRTEPVPTKHLTTLKTWSVAFRWQDRIATATTEAAERKLRDAAEVDADTFFLTSRKLNERVRETSPADAEVLVRIRESVRKPAAKGGTSVSVNVGVELRQIVDRIADEDGLTDEEKQELEESIQRHLEQTAR